MQIISFLSILINYKVSKTLKINKEFGVSFKVQYLFNNKKRAERWTITAVLQDLIITSIKEISISQIWKIDLRRFSNFH